MLKQAKFNKTVINQQVISNVNQMNKNMAELGVLEAEDQDMLLDLDSEKDSSFTQSSFFSEEKIVN